MRLWHFDILAFLPRSQLLAQWRELNSVFAKEDRHVLINYIYEYDKSELLYYTEAVMAEMKNRGYKIRSFDKYERYFADTPAINMTIPFARHHDDMYLRICYYNLYEKFIRGQKDYTREQFEALHRYVSTRIALHS